MIAAKAFDPVLGVDVHIVQPPGPVPPIPVPHPFIGMLIDPMDFAPFIGASVMVNGMPRATAGTGGKAVPPHIPIGGVFVKPPGNECEVFMGSATVVADGDPLSRLGMPALSCQDIGMPAPPRLKKKGKRMSLMLPTSVVLAVPAGPLVLVGGPPTISMMAIGSGLAKVGLGKAFKKLMKKAKVRKAIRRTKKALSAKTHGAAAKLMRKLGIPPRAQLKVHRAICTATGHPVDVATGKVFTDQVDVELPGPIPFQFERVWYSSSSYDGPLGHGWHHSYDLALLEEDGIVAVRLPDGRGVSFPAPGEGEEHFDRAERLRISRLATGFLLRDEASNLTYSFQRVEVWSTEHRLTIVEDRNANRLSFSYDPGQRLSWIRDSAGRGLMLEYDTQGRITAIHGPSPRSGEETATLVSYGYDPGGELAEVRDATGAPFRYRYEQHLLVQETDRQGLNFYFQYDGETTGVRCVRTWGDGNVFARELTYDDVGRQTEVLDSRGARTLYQWNDLGLVVRTVDAGGAVTEVEWSEYVQKLAETDASGATTEYEYDDVGRLLAVREPGGGQTVIEYDESGGPSVLVDALGQRWQQERDARGNIVVVMDPLGGRTTYHLDERGLPAEVVEADGSSTRLEWDTSGNLVTHEDSAGGVTRLVYDRLGQLVERIDPAGGRTRLAWDIAGRLVGAQDAEQRISHFVYDPAGNVVEATDPLGRRRRYRYGPMGVVAQAIEPSGATTQYHHDTEGDLVRVVDAMGRRWRFERDWLGRVVEERDVAGRRLSYSYDAAGRLEELRSDGAEGARMEWDEAGRLARRHYADGSSEEFGYDALGRMISATNEDATVELEYDALGRLVRESSDGDTVENRHDAMGRRVERTSPWGRRVAFHEDGRTRTRTISVNGTELLEREYDPFWQERRRRLPSGVESLREYSSTGELLESRTRRGGVDLLHRRYTYDGGGRLEGLFDSRSGSTEYTRDLDGYLRGVLYPERRLEEFLVDDAGNVPAAPLEASSVRDGTPADSRASHGSVPHPERGNGRRAEREMERVVVAEGAYLTYDADRRLIRKERRGQVWHYRYDAGSRLREVTAPEGHRTHFTYDALGRRLSKSWTSADGQASRSTRFFWDGNELLGEKDGGTGTIREYLFEEDSFAPLAVLEDGDDLIIENDQIGTPRIAYSRSTGEMAWKADLVAWGERRDAEEREAAGTEAVPFRFQGQYEDAETGLYYNQCRYYDPELRCYTQADPIGLAGGSQPHSYVPDPTGWIDPYGLIKVCGRPKGVTYHGKVHRFEDPARIGTTWQPHKWNRASRHRYTKGGSSGVYGGTSRETALAEITHYKALDGRVHVETNARVKNVLDLTDPKTRKQLGVNLNDIKGDSYKVPHEIGDWAAKNGYNGILAPSARIPGGTNLVVFGGL